MAAARAWLETNETAKEMLSRVLTNSPPFSFRPPLHRLPLRAGNVVEITGPSPSAKTHILIHAAVDCILPGQWKGADYGGLRRRVVFIDLDCKFDVLRLSHMLKQRIAEASGNGLLSDYIEELHSLCMKRFLYVRCYSSLELLSALKTLHHQLVKRVVEEEEEEEEEVDGHGNGAHCLMIDNIAAFHWMDRAVSSSKSSVSLGKIVEAVVMEVKKVLVVHPMLVMVTKATVLGGENRTGRNAAAQESPYREFMPSVWQSFVSHRLLVRAVDDDDDSCCEQSRYWLEWLLSSPGSFVEGFVVKDAGLAVLRDL